MHDGLLEREWWWWWRWRASGLATGAAEFNFHTLPTNLLPVHFFQRTRSVPHIEKLHELVLAFSRGLPELLHGTECLEDRYEHASVDIRIQIENHQCALVVAFWTRRETNRDGVLCPYGLSSYKSS